MKKAEIFQGSDDLKLIGTVVFYILVFFGIFATVLGLLGLITAKCYNKCCSCCYGLFVLIAALLFGTLGGFTLFVGANLGGFVSGVCSGTFSTTVPQINSLATKFTQFEGKVANWTSSYMCTSLCPCPPTVIP